MTRDVLGHQSSLLSLTDRLDHGCESGTQRRQTGEGRRGREGKRAREREREREEKGKPLKTVEERREERGEEEERPGMAVLLAEISGLAE